MTDLERITARRTEIAETRKALDSEDAELDIAERVLRRLSGSSPTPVIRRRAGRKASPDGIPASYRNVLEPIKANGGRADRGDVLDYVNAHRTEPLSEASYAARISKMVSEALIARDGTDLIIPKAEGGADVS